MRDVWRGGGIAGLGKEMTTLVRSGNLWIHPKFFVWLDADNRIAQDVLGPLDAADARDLMQALAQAVQAAELQAELTRTSEVVVK